MALLRWAVVTALIALIFAVLGFGNLAEGFADIAKVLFGIFIAIFLTMVLFGLVLAKKIV